MKILTLNCQRGYRPELKDFLRHTLISAEYDFILLQEFADNVPSYVRGVGNYNLLEAFNDEAREQSSLAIVYRTSIALLEHQFHSFSAMHNDPIHGLKHPHYGLLQGRFSFSGTVMVVGSLHLHAGMRPHIRSTEITKIKKEVKTFAQPNDMVIFGGDCNTGYVGETKRLSQILTPEFVQTTHSIGGTLDSRYTEYHPHVSNQIATLLAKVNLGVKLKTDHIFVDEKTAKTHTICCKILSDRVSDHSPVELVLNP